MTKQGMLFIQGKDRPGIVEAVTGILYQAGANLEDLSMTLLDGQFAMMVSFKIKSNLWLKLASKVNVLKKHPWNLNSDLVLMTQASKTKKNSAKSVLLTAIGNDRTGIVYQLSSGLAKMKANITNLDCRLLKRSKGADLYSLALEVDLVSERDTKKIEKLIRVWQEKLGIEVKLHLSESAVF